MDGRGPKVSASDIISMGTSKTTEKHHPPHQMIAFCTTCLLTLSLSLTGREEEQRWERSKPTAPTDPTHIKLTAQAWEGPTPFIIASLLPTWMSYIPTTHVYGRSLIPASLLVSLSTRVLRLQFWRLPAWKCDEQKMKSLWRRFVRHRANSIKGGKIIKINFFTTTL